MLNEKDSINFCKIIYTSQYFSELSYRHTICDRIVYDCYLHKDTIIRLKLSFDDMTILDYDS